jgi:hypothetical protein
MIRPSQPNHFIQRPRLPLIVSVNLHNLTIRRHYHRSQSVNNLIVSLEVP